jgi:hypothetical protein
VAAWRGSGHRGLRERFKGMRVGDRGVWARKGILGDLAGDFRRGRSGSHQLLGVIRARGVELLEGLGCALADVRATGQSWSMVQWRGELGRRAGKLRRCEGSASARGLLAARWG